MIVEDVALEYGGRFATLAECACPGIAGHTGNYAYGRHRSILRVRGTRESGEVGPDVRRVEVSFQ